MDATHFRDRAARARELAQTGDDLRLSRMLLEVALEMEAEAMAIDAEGITDCRSFSAMCRAGLQGARLRTVADDISPTLVEIIHLSTDGAKIRVDRPPTSGENVILELPLVDLRLNGIIGRVRGAEVAMVFDPSASTSPGLNRLLHSESLTPSASA